MRHLVQGDGEQGLAVSGEVLLEARGLFPGRSVEIGFGEGIEESKIGTAQFGVISAQVNAPRQIQLALKLLF